MTKPALQSGNIDKGARPMLGFLNPPAMHPFSSQGSLGTWLLVPSHGHVGWFGGNRDMQARERLETRED